MELQSRLHGKIDRTAKRVRYARLNTSLFVGGFARENWAMTQLALNLFPDIQLTVLLSRTESLGPRRWVAYGRIEGEAESHFIMAVDKENIAATALIPGRGIFRMLSDGTGMHTIAELDPSGFGACGSADLTLQNTDNATARKDHLPGSPVALLTIPPASTPTTSLVTIVDVMVVYTPEARMGSGGTSAMNTLIDLAVAEANTVYQNSEANTRLRLVYRGEVNYVEDSNLLTNLNRLQNKTDGFLDEVHPLRDTNRADVVCLITERSDPGVVGKAFTMTEPSLAFKAQAFSIVQRSQAVGTFIFAHEISHNFGCQHDRDNALDADGKLLPGAFAYSYGHRFTADGNTYRTVMAYAPGESIPYLSNPNVLFKGVPTGLTGTTNGANNTLTVNNTASIVGIFYGNLIQSFPPSVSLTDPLSTSVFSSGTSILLTAQAGDRDGRMQQIEFYAGNTLIGVVLDPLAGTTNLVGPSINSYNLIWTNVPAGEHTLTARAVDNLGASSASAPVRIVVRPFNDDFANRFAITGSAPAIAGTTRAGTREAGEPNHAGNAGGKSVWYSWQAPKSGTVWLTATGDGMTPLPDVYKSVAANALTTVAHDFEFDASNFVTRAKFEVTTGVTYSIAVDALAGLPGNFTLTLAFEPPPPNDNFVNRTLLSGEAINLSAFNVAATLEPGEPVHTGNPGGKSVWFGWNAPRSGAIIVNVAAANYFPLAEVYLPVSTSQVPTNIPPRAISFDQTNKITQLSLDVIGGQEYAFAVDGLAAQSGDFTISLSYPAAPSNDNFANRIQIAGTRVEIQTSNLYATREGGEPLHAGFKDEKSQGRKSIWYSWRAPVSGPVTLTCRGEGFYPLPDIYTGGTLNSLTNVPRRALSFAATNTVSTLTFTANAFRVYAVALDGFQGQSGSITFSLATAYSPLTTQLLATTTTPVEANIRLRLFGSVGQNYVIQAGTNLVDWNDVFLGTFAGTNTTTFTDENSGKFRYRFYRVLSLP